MRTIEVSEDVFRELQRRAEPFVDEPDDVIRRLLALAPGEAAREPANATGSDLVSSVGRVPHGASLRATYRGREYYAEVSNGRIIWDGKSYDSLSSAAVGVIQSTGARRPTENGWRFWEVQDPETKGWKEASHYRTRKTTRRR